MPAEVAVVVLILQGAGVVMGPWLTLSRLPIAMCANRRRAAGGCAIPKREFWRAAADYIRVMSDFLFIETMTVIGGEFGTWLWKT